jgi:hypothetical protein
VQKVKALNKKAEEMFPMLKDAVGKDGTAVIKKKIMMLFINAGKSEPSRDHILSWDCPVIHLGLHVWRFISDSGGCVRKSSTKVLMRKVCPQGPKGGIRALTSLATRDSHLKIRKLCQVRLQICPICQGALSLR